MVEIVRRIIPRLLAGRQRGTTFPRGTPRRRGPILSSLRLGGSAAGRSLHRIEHGCRPIPALGDSNRSRSRSERHSPLGFVRVQKVNCANVSRRRRRRPQEPRARPRRRRHYCVRRIGADALLRSGRRVDTLLKRDGEPPFRSGRRHRSRTTSAALVCDSYVVANRLPTE